MARIKTVTIIVDTSIRFDMRHEKGDEEELAAKVNKAIHAEMPGLRRRLLKALDMNDVLVGIEVA